ncbi:MAG: twin-arginine translocation signal domain-containing protein, partial [Candidatus Glassbacteria bacterium]
MTKKESELTRREFIGAIAGAAAGLAAAEARGQAGPAKVYPKSGKLLRIGIIGGRFGLSFQWHEH